MPKFKHAGETRGSRPGCDPRLVEPAVALRGVPLFEDGSPIIVRGGQASDPTLGALAEPTKGDSR